MTYSKKLTANLLYSTAWSSTLSSFGFDLRFWEKVTSHLNSVIWNPKWYGTELTDSTEHLVIQKLITTTYKINTTYMIII